MTVGQKIQKMRKEHGLSQNELACRITVSRQAVSKWENDESLPDVENLVQISKIFGVSLDYLLNEAVEKVEDVPIIKEIVETEKKKKNYIWVILCLSAIVIALFIGRARNVYITTLTGITVIFWCVVFIKLVCFLKKIANKL